MKKSFISHSLQSSKCNM